MCIRYFVQLLLWIWSVLVTNASVRCAFVYYIVLVRPHVNARPRNVTSTGVRSLLLGLLSYLFPFWNTRLSMYWGSRRERQPTIRQNRCSEVATTLELRESGGRRHSRHAMCRHQRCLDPADVTCDKFNNRPYFWKPVIGSRELPVTGRKPVNRLTGCRFYKPRHNVKGICTASLVCHFSTCPIYRSHFPIWDQLAGLVWSLILRHEVGHGGFSISAGKERMDTMLTSACVGLEHTHECCEWVESKVCLSSHSTDDRLFGRYEECTDTMLCQTNTELETISWVLKNCGFILCQFGRKTGFWLQF